MCRNVLECSRVYCVGARGVPSGHLYQINQGVPLGLRCIECSAMQLFLSRCSLLVLGVYRERSLQSATNYFIVSLAIADIMVAILVMPLAVYVEVNLQPALL